jgi:enoyl-CoA hydratase/carnithine racemase
MAAVAFSAEGPVGTITLDRPPANSYDIQFMLDLADTIGEASSHEAVRVVVVRSASERFFSAGADVKRFLANDVDANMDMIRLAHEALSSIARSPKLFVAEIAGHALGGGLEMALACDLRYAVEGSYKLGTPEVTLGLLPGNGGTQRLPRIIGQGPALELLLTGRQVGPEEAHRLGIVSGVFGTAEELRAHVEKLAAGPPLAIAEIKRCVYEGMQGSLDLGLALERELIEGLFRSRDANEGLTAFSEKRRPEFVGA